MNDFIWSQIAENIQVKQAFSEELVSKIAQSAELIIKAFENGAKLLICGNGGSAADSQHFATEIVSKFRKERKALPAIALSTNTSTLTAIGNDSDFSFAFARQVEALGQAKDVLFAISTSGNSKGVSLAMDQARERGLLVIGLTGKDDGKMASRCDVLLNVPSTDTARIQESHVMIIHVICDLIEQSLDDDQK